MTADDIAKILTSGADGIDTVKAWLPPETCDKAEKLIELVKEFLSGDMPSRRLSREGLVMGGRSFIAAYAALELTNEHLDSIKRVIHNIGESQRPDKSDGSCMIDRLQKILRSIADIRIVKRFLAWVLS